MKLVNLFERTIKVPQDLKEDILRMVVYAIYHYHTRGATENDTKEFEEVVEDITGYTVDALEMEFTGRLKRSVSGNRDYLGLSLFHPEDVPYYHSSRLVRSNMDQMAQDGVLPIDVLVMIRENDSSRYSIVKGTPKILINAHSLSDAFLDSWFNDTRDKKAMTEFKKLRSVVDHELQHLIQDIGLHKDQSAIKPNYGHGGRSEEDVHDDYYSSEAEIRPQLANLEQEFRNFTEGDEWWNMFDSEQKKEFFRMFVGLSSRGFDLEVGTQTLKVKIDTPRFFAALKKDAPKKYIKIVKDFYGMVDDLL